MKSQDDHHKEIEARERKLREREVELRLREMKLIFTYLYIKQSSISQKSPKSRG